MLYLSHKHCDLVRDILLHENVHTRCSTKMLCSTCGSLDTTAELYCSHIDESWFYGQPRLGSIHTQIWGWLLRGGSTTDAEQDIHRQWWHRLQYLSIAVTLLEVVGWTSRQEVWPQALEPVCSFWELLWHDHCSFQHSASTAVWSHVCTHVRHVH